MSAIKVKSVKPLKNQILEVEFVNKEVKLYDVKQLFEEFEDYKLLMNDDIFNLVHVDCGGSAIAFNEDLDITEHELYENGVSQTKIVNKTLYKNGQGRIGSKINIPLGWIQHLGVTEEDQEIQLTFLGDKIIIQK